MNWTPINLNSVNLRVDLSTEFSNHLPVNSHPSLGNKLLHLSTRADTTLGKKLLETDCCHIGYLFEDWWVL
jgi:hypothetical protein